MSDILKKLVENSRLAIDSGVYDVKEDLSGMRSDFDLRNAMVRDASPTLICEIKYASPSAGRIRDTGSPADIARQMIAGGASAISVLTQPHMFSGSPENLMQVRRAVDVPILMKDIVIDVVQIEAAKRMGADYILLIQAVYMDGGVEEMVKHAHKAGLKVLLEAHTKEEMEMAVRTDADLVGINNRSLQTLQVEMGTTARIIGNCGDCGPFVVESGIKTPQDVRDLRDAGARAFLVGSSIMSSEDVAGAVGRLAGAYP